SSRRVVAREQSCYELDELLFEFPRRAHAQVLPRGTQGSRQVRCRGTVSRPGQLLYGRRFSQEMDPTRWPREMAIAWAEEELKAIIADGEESSRLWRTHDASSLATEDERSGMDWTDSKWHRRRRSRMTRRPGLGRRIKRQLARCRRREEIEDEEP